MSEFAQAIFISLSLFLSEFVFYLIITSTSMDAPHWIPMARERNFIQNQFIVTDSQSIIQSNSLNVAIDFKLQ